MSNPQDRTSKLQTCESQGHLWGPSGKCIFCPTYKPEQQDSRLRLWGVSRVQDNPHALTLCFDRTPTDDEMRDIHERFRTAVDANAGASNVLAAALRELLAAYEADIYPGDVGGWSRYEARKQAMEQAKAALQAADVDSSEVQP